MAYAYCRSCEDVPLGPPTPGDCVVGYITCLHCEGEHPLEDFEHRDIINKAMESRDAETYPCGLKRARPKGHD